MTARKLARGVNVELAAGLRPAVTSNTASPAIPDLYQPPHEVVARLAFEIYETRPDYPGRDWEDWFEAESILRLQAHVAQLTRGIPAVEAEPKLPV